MHDILFICVFIEAFAIGTLDVQSQGCIAHDFFVHVAENMRRNAPTQAVSCRMQTVEKHDRCDVLPHLR